jgi:flagellar protein FlaG
MLLSGLQRVATTGNAPAETGTPVARQAPPANAAVPARVAPEAPPQQQVSEPQRAEIEAAVAAAREQVRSTNSNLQFSIDEESGKTVVRVLDASTNEVIRQFPSEEMLAVARNLGRLEGILLDKKA